MKPCISLFSAIYFVVLISGAATAFGQSYPSKPVRFIVGTAAGGSTDTIGRIVAQELSRSWGQNVVVDNRPGAGATIAADLVAKSQPDGYTVLVGGFGPIAMAGSLYPKLPYDPANDFAHVTLMVSFPNVVVVPDSSSISSLKNLIEQAKARPGVLKYGSSGVGGSGHVFIELMNLSTGVNTVHVPYRGGPSALAGMLGGEVDYVLPAISTALGLLSAKRVRALAVTSANASPRLPNVPPISSTLPGYDALEFHGLHAPAKTPQYIVAKLQRDVSTILRRADVKERLDSLAMDVSANSTEEFSNFIRKQIQIWTKVGRAANIRAD
jgi:tripartite-type tricarboxylate transporter receptor subunit TctC